MARGGHAHVHAAAGGCVGGARRRHRFGRRHDKAKRGAKRARLRWSSIIAGGHEWVGSLRSRYSGAQTAVGISDQKKGILAAVPGHYISWTRAMFLGKARWSAFQQARASTAYRRTKREAGFCALVSAGQAAAWTAFPARHAQGPHGPAWDRRPLDALSSLGKAGLRWVPLPVAQVGRRAVWFGRAWRWLWEALAVVVHGCA